MQDSRRLTPVFLQLRRHTGARLSVPAPPPAYVILGDVRAQLRQATGRVAYLLASLAEGVADDAVFGGIYQELLVQAARARSLLATGRRVLAELDVQPAHLGRAVARAFANALGEPHAVLARVAAFEAGEQARMLGLLQALRDDAGDDLAFAGPLEDAVRRLGGSCSPGRAAAASASPGQVRRLVECLAAAAVRWPGPLDALAAQVAGAYEQRLGAFRCRHPAHS